MRKELFRVNGFMILAFYLLSIILVISVIIYGFDIKFSGGRKALTSEIKNSGQTDYYFKINETFAFGVDTDMPGHVGVLTYNRNYFPLCFTCGWNKVDTDDDRGLLAPIYRKGDLFYSSEPDEHGWSGGPKNAYNTLNIETGEFGYVMDTTELGVDPFAKSKRVKFSFLMRHFEELSFFSHDDEDCMISFMAVFAGYSILLVWWLILVLIRWIRSSLRKA